MFYRRRERFQHFSVRVGTAFSKLGLSPNQWTLFTLVPTLLALWFLVRQEFLAAAVLFLIATFIDLIDGSVARVTGRVTRLGAYLDTVIDRYVEGIIAFGLLFASLPDVILPGLPLIPTYAWIFLYLFGATLTTYVKAAAMEKGIVEKELRGGLMERAERLIVLFIGILLASLNPVYLTYIIILLAVLTNFTALQRIRIAVKSGK